MKVLIKGVEFTILVQESSPGLFDGIVVECPELNPVRGTDKDGVAFWAERRLRAFVQADARSAHQLRVDKFMRLAADLKAKAGQPIDGQSVPFNVQRSLPWAARRLRAALILEECLETIQALGVAVHPTTDLTDQTSVTMSEFQFRDAGNMDLNAVVDGCLDLAVVTTGTLTACGVSDLRPQELVDQNNLDKFKPVLCPECSSVMILKTVPWPIGNKMETEQRWVCSAKGTIFKEDGSNFPDGHSAQPLEVGAHVNDLGKIVKPVGHKPPTLGALLDAMA